MREIGGLDLTAAVSRFGLKIAADQQYALLPALSIALSVDEPIGLPLGTTLGDLFISVHLGAMLTQDIAIRAKRKLTNRLIAAHDASRLRPHLTDDMMLIAGNGELIDGADAVVAAFASQFAASGFISYVRTTTSIEITDDSQRAAELGRWTGNWQDGSEMSGIYMATWRNNRGQWLLERELYITLQG